LLHQLLQLAAHTRQLRAGTGHACIGLRTLVDDGANPLDVVADLGGARCLEAGWSVLLRYQLSRASSLLQTATARRNT